MKAVKNRFDYIIDANVIIQYLIREDEKQYIRAYEILHGYKCYATHQIICEVIYILIGVYDVPRDKIVESLKKIQKLITVEDADVMNVALDAFLDKPKLDISDCLLYALHVLSGLPVYTFDQKLNKKINRRDSSASARDSEK